MKKTVAVILILVLVFTLAACDTALKDDPRSEQVFASLETEEITGQTPAPEQDGMSVEGEFHEQTQGSQDASGGFSVSATEEEPKPTVMPVQTPVPTAEPSAQPTAEPSAQPTAEPSAQPTAEPSAQPTAEPSAQPTAEPSAQPTAEPSVQPTGDPHQEDTSVPQRDYEKEAEEAIRLFAQIDWMPRTSHNEQKIISFLTDWAERQGLTALTDATGNVMIEKPASPGRENAPLTILHSNMDMFCSVEPGTQFDPLTDPIFINSTGWVLSAKNTSIGAQSGVGMAVILQLLRADIQTGPIRAVFTVDGEDTMTGAQNIDPAWLDGKYLISMTWQKANEVAVCGADSKIYSFTRAPEYTGTTKDQAYTLSLTGLLGGNAGAYAADERVNALRVLALTLEDLNQQGIALELASFTGGEKCDTIPNNAAATVVVGAGDAVRAEQIIQQNIAAFYTAYAQTEKNAQFTCTKEERLPERVLSDACAQSVLRLALLVKDGVGSVNKTAVLDETQNVVQSSHNLGLLSMTDEAITLEVYYRSEQQEETADTDRFNTMLAGITDFTVSVREGAPAWIGTAGSAAKTLSRAYTQATGGVMQEVVAHSDMECGWFAQKNPKLDIAAVGITVLNLATSREACTFYGVKTQIKTLENTLLAIAEETQA